MTIESQEAAKTGRSGLVSHPPGLPIGNSV